MAARRHHAGRMIAPVRIITPSPLKPPRPSGPGIMTGRAKRASKPPEMNWCRLPLYSRATCRAANSTATGRARTRGFHWNGRTGAFSCGLGARARPMRCRSRLKTHSTCPTWSSASCGGTSRGWIPCRSLRNLGPLPGRLMRLRQWAASEQRLRTPH